MDEANTDTLYETAMYIRRWYANRQCRWLVDMWRNADDADWRAKADELEKKIEDGEFFGDGGNCGWVSPLLTKALRLSGIKARTIYGKFVTDKGKRHHAWVKVGNRIVDATFHQFGAEKVIVTDASDSRYLPMTKRTWTQN